MSEAQLIDRIGNRSARISVIGQGYVGLPLALEFARAGFTVSGLDEGVDRHEHAVAPEDFAPVMTDFEGS